MELACKKTYFPQSHPAQIGRRAAAADRLKLEKNAAAIFTIFLFHGQVTLFAKNLDFSGSLPSCSRPLLVKINHETYASKVFVSWKAREENTVFGLKREWAGLAYRPPRRVALTTPPTACTHKRRILRIFFSHSHFSWMARSNENSSIGNHTLKLLTKRAVSEVYTM